MRYNLSIEKCRKLSDLLKGFEVVKEHDLCYILEKKWVMTSETTQSLVDNVVVAVFGDVSYMNMRFDKTRKIVKIPSLDDFFELLDADIKEIDYQNNKIVSTKKMSVGYTFNNSKKDENIVIDGENLYEALYNLTMLLYSKEK